LVDQRFFYRWKCIRTLKWGCVSHSFIIRFVSIHVHTPP
jgi:hypothetical protein